jgi:predicted RNase H-like HicB family nuclease
LTNIREAIDLYLEEEEPLPLPEKAQIVELVL